MATAGRTGTAPAQAALGHFCHKPCGNILPGPAHGLIVTQRFRIYPEQLLPKPGGVVQLTGMAQLM